MAQSRKRAGQPTAGVRRGAHRDDSESEFAHAVGVAPRMPVPVTKGQVLQLQRTAGNRAVQSLLQSPVARRAPAIQRLTTKATDLDELMGKSTRGTLGMGGSSYAELRKALANYEKAAMDKKKGTEAGLIVLLDKVDRLAMKWINTHKDDAARQARIRALVDEIGAERLKISKGQADLQYIKSMASEGTGFGGVEGPAGKDFEHTFKMNNATIGMSAYSNYGSDIGTATKWAEPEDKARVEKEETEKHAEQRAFVAKYGLTASEAAAIRLYTFAGSQYTMMNAAASNDKGWIGNVVKDSTFKVKGVDAKVLGEEGGLHTAMATQAIMKLPPYRGLTYRGESVTRNDLATRLKPGQVWRFPGLTSSSREEGVATGYRATGVSDSRPVGIVWEFENVGGRHVETISEVAEAEVLLPPGTEVVVLSITYEKDEVKKGVTYPLYRIKTLPRPKTRAPEPFTGRPLPK
jgi:hypothetical protein